MNPNTSRVTLGSSTSDFSFAAPSSPSAQLPSQRPAASRRPPSSYNLSTTNTSSELSRSSSLSRTTTISQTRSTPASSVGSSCTSSSNPTRKHSVIDTCTTTTAPHINVSLSNSRLSNSTSLSSLANSTTTSTSTSTHTPSTSNFDSVRFGRVCPRPSARNQPKQHQHDYQLTVSPSLDPYMTTTSHDPTLDALRVRYTSANFVHPFSSSSSTQRTHPQVPPIYLHAPKSQTRGDGRGTVGAWTSPTLDLGGWSVSTTATAPRRALEKASLCARIGDLEKRMELVERGLAGIQLGDEHGGRLGDGDDEGRSKGEVEDNHHDEHEEAEDNDEEAHYASLCPSSIRSTPSLSSSDSTSDSKSPSPSLPSHDLLANATVLPPRHTPLAFFTSPLQKRSSTDIECDARRALEANVEALKRALVDLKVQAGREGLGLPEIFAAGDHDLGTEEMLRHGRDGSVCGVDMLRRRAGYVRYAGTGSGDEQDEDENKSPTEAAGSGMEKEILMAMAEVAGFGNAVGGMDVQRGRRTLRSRV